MPLNIATYIKTPIVILLLLCFNGFSSIYSNESKNLTDYLDHLILNKDEFTQEKEKRISSLKALLKDKTDSWEYEYEINLKLYEEYRKYILESAIFYARRNVVLADSVNDRTLMQSARIQLASAFSYSGKQREAEVILENIDREQLPKSLLPDYYEAYHRFFEHYGAISGQHQPQTELYRDSLLTVLDPASIKYKITLIHLYINKNIIDEAENMLYHLLQTENDETPEYALITHYLGAINGIKNKSDLELKFYTLSAIADIKNSIKENASFQRLAFIYYGKGDIARAFNYTQTAIEDAVFSGVQFRMAEMAGFYSIINASYQEKEAKTKAQLKLYIVLISILTLTLTILFLYIYRQMKHKSKMKEDLYISNNKLVLLNNELNESNDYLFEANHIKEQYIIHFLDLCSDYITKMEDYRISLNRLALNNQMDKLLKRLRSGTQIVDEIENLYKNFDSVFLSLYPTFVSEFNNLLAKEEQIVPKQNELLNRELRIFALLRLGISDTAKIASFLRCSISTVYNYRTRIRNKAIVPRDEFENYVMKIGEMHINKQ